MSEIKPAMNAEEWAGVRPVAYGGYDDTMYALGCDIGLGPSPARLHEMAARCLYGQPFGFDHKDVDALDSALTYAAENPAFPADLYDKAKTAITKLEALLPPR